LRNHLVSCSPSPLSALWTYQVPLHHCPTHPAQLPTQTGPTHCRSVLVGSIVAPHYPFSVPVALSTSRSLPSLCHHRTTHPTLPPTQTGLTRHQSVLVGSVVAPHYPFSMPVALWTSSTLSLPHPFWSLDLIVIFLCIWCILSALLHSF